MKVNCIKMCLHDSNGVEREVGRAYADRFIVMLPPGPFMPDLRRWYENIFFGIDNSDTFEERFQLVVENQYFCFSKPGLRLYACKVDE